jgi:hypothetical protein
MINFIYSDLNDFTNKLEKIEKDLEDKQTEFDKRKRRKLKLENDVRNVITMNKKIDTLIVHIEIGGTKFCISKNVIFSLEDSLLAKLIKNDNYIFIDRNSELFPYILKYYRTKKIEIEDLDKEIIRKIKEEMEFYNITKVVKFFNNQSREIRFINFEASGTYTHNDKRAGTNKVEDLHDNNTETGICTDIGGWIIIDFNIEIYFDEIEICGFKSTKSFWDSRNGANSTIYTSNKRLKWNKVGNIHREYKDEIKLIKLIRSSARYIKFHCNNYLGISYLKIINIV